MDGKLLTEAALLAAVVKILVDYAFNPVKAKFPNLDTWWLVYVTWAIGGVLTYFSGLNLFPSTFTYPLVGQVLTSVLVGGGSNLLNDVIKAASNINQLVKDRLESNASNTAGQYQR